MHLPQLKLSGTRRNLFCVEAELLEPWRQVSALWGDAHVIEGEGLSLAPTARRLSPPSTARCRRRSKAAAFGLVHHKGGEQLLRLTGRPYLLGLWRSSLSSAWSRQA